MLETDKIGQSSSDFDNVCDNITRLVCGMNVCKANKLVIGTCDPTRLQPMRSFPFLVSPNDIPYYKIVQIKNSVRAQTQEFFRLQQIARTSYKELLGNSDLISEFEHSCNGFTFVQSLNSPLITPDAFRMHARNIPAKEAHRNFIASMKRAFSSSQLRLRSSVDLQQRRVCHDTWEDAVTTIRSCLY